MNDREARHIERNIVRADNIANLEEMVENSKDRIQKLQRYLENQIQADYDTSHTVELLHEELENYQVSSRHLVAEKSTWEKEVFAMFGPTWQQKPQRARRPGDDTPVRAPPPPQPKMGPSAKQRRAGARKLRSLFPKQPPAPEA